MCCGMCVMSQVNRNGIRADSVKMSEYRSYYCIVCASIEKYMNYLWFIYKFVFVLLVPLLKWIILCTVVLGYQRTKFQDQILYMKWCVQSTLHFLWVPYPWIQPTLDQFSKNTPEDTGGQLYMHILKLFL